MLALAGIGVVIAAVIGGFTLAGGKLLVLMQPAEFVVICGAALGAVLIANGPTTIKRLIRQLTTLPKSGPTKNDYLEALNERFFANLNEGKHTVIIVDEAQTIINPLTFEEIRLLLNFQLKDRFLTTLLLFGQTELAEKVQNFPQLNQRISLKYKLQTLGKVDTEKYINYRLHVAGAREKIFSDDAQHVIWKYSGGTPRVINTIADWCLLLGYTRLRDKIGEQIATKAVTELGYTPIEE